MTIVPFQLELILDKFIYLWPPHWQPICLTNGTYSMYKAYTIISTKIGIQLKIFTSYNPFPNIGLSIWKPKHVPQIFHSAVQKSVQNFTTVPALFCSSSRQLVSPKTVN
jgi:hypothetical protein